MTGMGAKRKGRLTAGLGSEPHVSSRGRNSEKRSLTLASCQSLRVRRARREDLDLDGPVEPGHDD